MNKQLISILRLVAVGVIVISKILDWVGDEHSPVAPTTNNYYIVIPGQPHAAAQRIGEERPPAHSWERRREL
jgi:hypothetical protein